MWSTTSLRGLMMATLRVDVLSEAVSVRAHTRSHWRWLRGRAHGAGAGQTNDYGHDPLIIVVLSLLH
jgi:hypothetical protein